MKNILLTTTALVAFAGAAAADGHTSVSFSGGASAEYNSLGGFNTDADLDATMSAELDNGLSVSTKISIDTANYKGEATKSGSLTLSSDTASLSFGTGMNGAAFNAVGDTIAIGDTEETVDGVTASYTMGAGTLFVSMPLAAGATKVASTDIEVGVTAAVGAMTVGLAMANSDFVGKVSGTAAGATFTAVAGSVNDKNVWDVSASYPVGAVTVGYTVDSTTGNPWEVSAAYAADGLSAKVTYASASEKYKVEGSYDMGNGAVVNAGYLGATDETYIGGSYALGGGASAYASYVDSTTATAASEIGGPDYAGGTTVGVSFTF